MNVNACDCPLVAGFFHFECPFARVAMRTSIPHPGYEFSRSEAFRSRAHDGH